MGREAPGVCRSASGELGHLTKRVLQKPSSVRVFRFRDRRLLLGLAFVSKVRWDVLALVRGVLIDPTVKRVCSRERSDTAVDSWKRQATPSTPKIIKAHSRFQDAVSSHGLPVSFCSRFLVRPGSTSNGFDKEMGSRRFCCLVLSIYAHFVHRYLDIIVDLLGGLNSVRIVK